MTRVRRSRIRALAALAALLLPLVAAAVPPETYRKAVAKAGRKPGRAAGKVAIVTGAAQGFGLEIAHGLAAQGAGKVGGPIAAQAMRLLLVVIAGFLLAVYEAPLWSVFVLSTVAMIVMGLSTAFLVKRTAW